PPASGFRLPVVGAGTLIGAAFVLKYNAGLYALLLLPALMTGALRGASQEATYTGTPPFWRDVAAVMTGAATVPVLMLIPFWRGGALDDLYPATLGYNLRDSGVTYATLWGSRRCRIRGPL